MSPPRASNLTTSAPIHLTVPSPTSGKTTMNRTFRTRATAVLGAVVLGAVAVFGAAAPANAVNIDSSTPVTLTIHKHAKTSTNGTTPGTGEALNPAPGAGINGVSFTVQRVGTIDLATDAGWDTVEAIQARLAAGDTITQALAATGQTLGASTTVTTADVAGQDGVAAVPGVVKSMYLVSETTAPSSVTEKAAPFLVTLPQAKPSTDSWIYDVHVYPKNSLSGLTKTVVAPTAAETAAGRDLVRYDLVADVPYLTQNTTAFANFAVSDTVDTAYQTVVTTAPSGVPAAATVTLTNAASANIALVPADYELNSFNGGTEYRVTFTSTGLAKLVTAQGGKVTFSVLTRITDVPANGQIVNRAGTNINNSVNGTFAGATPGTPITATTEFGDLQVFTHVNGANTPLGPATYALLDASGNPVIINGTAVTGIANATTGLVTFENLPIGNYQLDIVTPPAGYNRVGTDPRPVTVVAGGPVRDAANPTAPGDNYVPVAFTQTPAWVLPLTGGDGGVLFTFGGGALVALALGAAFIVARRKRATIDEVETSQI